MSTKIAEVKPRRSITTEMAHRFGMEREAFESTLMKTVMPDKGVNKEQVAAFLVVAREYKLNPFTREIFAFPARNGGIQPVVSVDGWLKIINSHDQFDGMTFEDAFNDEGKLVAVTCRMYRKDRDHPVEVTEYMDECHRDTDTWKKYPARMLRHKATIQAARYTFGFSGIVDPDEAERIVEMGEVEVVPSLPEETLNDVHQKTLVYLEESNAEKMKELWGQYGIDDQVILWRMFNSAQRTAIKKLEAQEK